MLTRKFLPRVVSRAKPCRLFYRGTLVEGAPADIVIYDLDKLRVLPQGLAHDLPGDEWRRVQRAEGYRYVPVTGEVTIENDLPTNARPGLLLRHGHAPV